VPTREGGHKVKVGGTVKKFSGALRQRETVLPLSKSLRRLCSAGTANVKVNEFCLLTCHVESGMIQMRGLSGRCLVCKPDGKESCVTSGMTHERD